MKDYLKTFFIFFAFFISLLITGQSDIDYNVQPTNYIQNDCQKVVLISNTFNGGEIFAGKIQKTPNLTGNNQSVSYIDFPANIFVKNTTHNNRYHIYNTSSLLENNISIRAP